MYDVYKLTAPAGMTIEYATLCEYGSNFERIRPACAQWSDWFHRPEAIPAAATFDRAITSLLLA